MVGGGVRVRTIFKVPSNLSHPMTGEAGGEQESFGDQGHVLLGNLSLWPGAWHKAHTCVTQTARGTDAAIGHPALSRSMFYPPEAWQMFSKVTADCLGIRGCLDTGVYELRT